MLKYGYKYRVENLLTKVPKKLLYYTNMSVCKPLGKREFNCYGSRHVFFLPFCSKISLLIIKGCTVCSGMSVDKYLIQPHFISEPAQVAQVGDVSLITNYSISFAFCATSSKVGEVTTWIKKEVL